MTCCICNVPINKKWNRNHCIQCYYKKKLIKQKKEQDEIKRKKPLKHRVCFTCKRNFTSKYKVEKFCSSECRVNLSNRIANEQWASECPSSKKEKSRQPSVKRERKNSFNKFTVNLPKETYRE